MNRIGLLLASALLAVGLGGTYWVVRAQDGRPLFAPPAVLPTDKADKKEKYPYQTQPLRDGKKKADATLIVPPEAYDVPRPVKGGEVDLQGGVRGIVHLEDPVPTPAFPPLPVPAKDTSPAPTPPSLPALDAPPLPMPILDPTKVLIKDPSVKEASAPAQPIRPPLVKPEPKVETPPLPLPSPSVLIPPPVVMPEPKKETPGAAQPLPIPEAPKPGPTTIVLPNPTPVQPPRPAPFVRIDSAAQNKAPEPTPGPVLPPNQTLLDFEKRRALEQQLAQPPLPVPNGVGLSGLLNLQTPSVTVEKRGPGKLRRREPVSYQIVVRNLGPVPAHAVRIEDEIPAGATIVGAQPQPQVQGNKAIWVLPTINVNHEQTIRLTLEADAEVEATGRIAVQVQAASQATKVLRPRVEGPALSIQLVGPGQIAMGKPVTFEIRVSNQSTQPMTGLVLHGLLPEGLNTPQGREIEGEVDATVAPGEVKTLKMPANAVKPGRYTVGVKVTTQAGHEASATTPIEIASESLHVQQAPLTRLFMARDGDLRIEVANYTNKPLRNVAVADQLPPGLDFVAASDRGLYQANRRTVYWLLDQLAPGQTQTLVVRVNGAKAGQHQNIVFVKADGVAEAQSAALVALESVADLTLRVIDRDNPLEVGKETVYEIQVQNPGNAPAGQVRVQVHFPPGLIPKAAEGKTRHTIEQQTIVFEPLGRIEAQGQAIYRVSALAQTAGDQRVRFSVVSDQVRTPIQREISTKVYSDR